MKAVVAAFKQEKALVGAFSVITNLRMELFEALISTLTLHPHPHAVPAQATVEDSLVEFVDILPTLVEAAGLPDLELCPEYSRNVSICR